MNSNFIIKICLKSPESVIYAELIWKKGDIIVMRNAIYEQNESVVLVSLSINLSYIKSITTLTEEELSKYKKTIMDAPGNDGNHLECACKQVGDEMKSQEKTSVTIVEKPISNASVTSEKPMVEKPTLETPVDVNPETKKPTFETPVDVNPEIKKPVPETPVTAKPDSKKQEFKKQDHKKQDYKKPVDSKKSETHKNTDSSLERKFSSMKITNTPVEDSKATPYKPATLGKQDRPTTPPPKQATKQDRPATPPPKQHVKQDRPVTPPPKQAVKQERPVTPPPKQGIKQDRPVTPPPKQSTKQVTNKQTTSYKSDRPSTPPKPSNWETFNASVAKPYNGWNKKEEKPTYNKSGEKPVFNKSNVKYSVKDNGKDEKSVYNKSSEKPVYNKSNEKPVYNKTNEKPVYNKASPTKPHPDTKSHSDTKASPMKNHTDNKSHPDTKPTPKSDYKPKQDTRYTNNNSNYNAYNNYKKEVATNVVYKTNRNIEVSFKGRKYTELAPLMQALRGNMATLPKSEEWGIPGETTVVEKGKKILVAGKTKFYNRRNY